MANRMGISQPAYSQMEKPSARLRLKTKIRIASALGISPKQLTLN
jgi:transcriptional regulator with XRE-family HTH domain